MAPKLRLCCDMTLGSALRFMHKMAFCVPLSYLPSRADRASLCEPQKSHPRDQECFFHNMSHPLDVREGHSRVAISTCSRNSVETLKLLCLDVTCHTLACHSRQSVPLSEPSFLSCQVRLAERGISKKACILNKGWFSFFNTYF